MQEIERIARRRCGLLAATALALAACGGDPAAPDSAAPAASGFLPPAPEAARGCGPSGRLDGEFFGAVEATLALGTDKLDCEGMPRPEGRGARLRFAGSTADAGPFVLIVAIPDLEARASGAELGTNVTLIDERSGRFFSTPDLNACWTDIEAQTALEGDDAVAVTGRLYCIAPLVEVNGPASVSIRELRFTGLLDWSTT